MREWLQTTFTPMGEPQEIVSGPELQLAREKKQ